MYEKPQLSHQITPLPTLAVSTAKKDQATNQLSEDYIVTLFPMKEDDAPITLSSIDCKAVVDDADDESKELADETEHLSNLGCPNTASHSSTYLI